MEQFSPEQREWVVRPLIDAGLDVNRISDLLFRLGFEDIVSQGRGTATQVIEMVGQEPPHVRAAWNEVIGRMILLHRSGG